MGGKLTAVALLAAGAAVFVSFGGHGGGGPSRAARADGSGTGVQAKTPTPRWPLFPQAPGRRRSRLTRAGRTSSTSQSADDRGGAYVYKTTDGGQHWLPTAARVCAITSIESCPTLGPSSSLDGSPEKYTPGRPPGPATPRHAVHGRGAIERVRPLSRSVAPWLCNTFLIVAGHHFPPARLRRSALRRSSPAMSHPAAHARSARRARAPAYSAGRGGHPGLVLVQRRVNKPPWTRQGLGFFCSR